jgi:hypothetical protein
MRGGVLLNGQHLDAGDGAAVSDEELVQIMGDAPGGEHTEILLFDLA